MTIHTRTCPNGHYYNADIYDTCPECGASKDQSAHTPQNVIPTPEMCVCPNGHYYNADIYDTCPECGAGGQDIPSSHRQSPHGGYFCVLHPVPGRTPFIEPVVGWLVCIEGPMRGADLRLHDGYNLIGRESGDVLIPDDDAVSPRHHAVIAFYSKRDAFYAGPGENGCIIELNGEPILTHSEIKPGDILTIGNSRFELVALRNAGSRWK